MDLKQFLVSLRDEVNNEIRLFERAPGRGYAYYREKWERLRYAYDGNVSNHCLLKVDVSVEKSLRKNEELAVVRELREPIINGLRRLREVLGTAEKKINTMHRAEELLADINDRHLPQFEKRLSEL